MTVTCAPSLTPVDDDAAAVSGTWRDELGHAGAEMRGQLINWRGTMTSR